VPFLREPEASDDEAIMKNKRKPEPAQ